MKEVRDHLDISGISAGAYLCTLRTKGVLKYDHISKTHQKVEGKEVLK